MPPGPQLGMTNMVQAASLPALQTTQEPALSEVEGTGHPTAVLMHARSKHGPPADGSVPALRLFICVYIVVVNAFLGYVCGSSRSTEFDPMVRPKNAVVFDLPVDHYISRMVVDGIHHPLGKLYGFNFAFFGDAHINKPRVGGSLSLLQDCASIYGSTVIEIKHGLVGVIEKMGNSQPSSILCWRFSGISYLICGRKRLIYGEFVDAIIDAKPSTLIEMGALPSQGNTVMRSLRSIFGSISRLLGGVVDQEGENGIDDKGDKRPSLPKQTLILIVGIGLLSEELLRFSMPSGTMMENGCGIWWFCGAALAFFVALV
jgi:hypothetical protein